MKNTQRKEGRAWETFQVHDLRTITSQKCEAVPKKARIQGSYTCLSLNFRLDSNKEDQEGNLFHCVLDADQGSRVCHALPPEGLRFGI